MAVALFSSTKSRLLRGSAITFFVPFTRIVLMPNSSRRSFYRMTLSDTLSVVSCTRFVWSVKTSI